MDSGNADRNLVSVAEVARTLSRSTEQVRRYLREGRLTGRRVGGQWFIERQALEAFAAGSSREDKFLRTLRPANRQHPLDDVMSIGEGPGSNISSGKHVYRLAALRNAETRGRNSRRG